MSYYETLGVDKTATQEEIKKAYRNLSKQYHPDMSGGDDTKFKEIAEAYDTLSNPDKRKRYDMGGGSHDFFNRAGWSDNMNMSDLFDQMFGGQFRQQQAQKGLDVSVQLQINFSEAYQGTSKSFNINGHNITMNFKPGLKTGQKFRVRGKGQPHPYNSNLPNGDVIINIHVMADARFILQGDDIWVETTLPWYDIMLGSKALVQTPDGPVSITVPQGTKPASTLRIKDKGFPIYNTGKRGSLLCRVNASYPELNQTQVEHLNQIRNAK